MSCLPSSFWPPWGELFYYTPARVSGLTTAQQQQSTPGAKANPLAFKPLLSGIWHNSEATDRDRYWSLRSLEVSTEASESKAKRYCQLPQTSPGWAFPPGSPKNLRDDQRLLHSTPRPVTHSELTVSPVICRSWSCICQQESRPWAVTPKTTAFGFLKTLPEEIGTLWWFFFSLNLNCPSSYEPVVKFRLQVWPPSTCPKVQLVGRTICKLSTWMSSVWSEFIWGKTS